MNTILSPKLNYSPNFHGHSRQIQTQIDKVLNYPENNIETKLANTIKHGLSTILTREKFIEEGTHNAVYKITRKYALRVPRKSVIEPDRLPDKVTKGKGIFSGLKNYFGEAIIELGKLQILRNVGKHCPAGVPEHLTKILNQNEIKKYYLNNYLPKFAAIPQAAYDTLAQDINKLNEITLGPRRFCIFDSLNPNNVVTRNGKLYLVDEIDTLCDRSYSNTTAKLLEIFINRASSNIESPSAGEKLPLVRKIFKKVVLASSKANLLHANSNWDFKNWEKALQKCRIKNDTADVLNTLDNIENNSLDVKERARKTRAYLDELFVTNHISG